MTERFCQDPVENYFCQQRAIGARKDNPSVRDFGFNDNSIRNQKIFRPIAGNVCGQDIGMVDFTNEALPCRKKLKKIESDHVTLLEFLLSLTRHQIKTAIFIATQKKSKEDSEEWIIREQLSTVQVCFVHITLCHF